MRTLRDDLRSLKQQDLIAERTVTRLREGTSRTW